MLYAVHYMWSVVHGFVEHASVTNMSFHYYTKPVYHMFSHSQMDTIM